ncbi:hypothetical protein Daus18300_011084, partial [Diaporthe australafricana]
RTLDLDWRLLSSILVARRHFTITLTTRTHSFIVRPATAKRFEDETEGHGNGNGHEHEHNHNHNHDEVDDDDDDNNNSIGLLPHAPEHVLPK